MKESRNLLEPRGGVWVAAENHHDDVFLDSCQLGDKLVLTVAQVVTLPVTVLAVLPVVFVQSSHEDDEIGLTCLLQCLCLEGCLLGWVDRIHLIIDGAT